MPVLTSRRAPVVVAAALALLAVAQGTVVGTSSAAPAGFMAVGHAEIGEASATWSPRDYDGVALAADAPDLNALPKVHGVYIHPVDVPSRFGQFAAYFQAEQRRASRFLTNATGMAFRWDERISRDGRRLHDITVVRSVFPAALLSSPAQFDLVGQTLSDAGLDHPDKKYYVWLDATSDYCGQGQRPSDPERSPDNLAETSTFAISYRVDSERYAAVGGFCNPVIHELTHGFGAVSEYMPSYRDGHCDDDPNDVMCLISVSPGGKIDRSRSRTYDGGNDDYLDPAADLADRTGEVLDTWAVNLSRFWCPRSSRDRTRPDCSKPNRPGY